MFRSTQELTSARLCGAASVPVCRGPPLRSPKTCWDPLGAAREETAITLSTGTANAWLPQPAQTPTMQTRIPVSPATLVPPHSGGPPPFHGPPRSSISIKRTTTAPTLLAAPATPVTFAKSTYDPHCGHFTFGPARDDFEDSIPSGRSHVQATPSTSAGQSSVSTPLGGFSSNDVGFTPPRGGGLAHGGGGCFSAPVCSMGRPAAVGLASSGTSPGTGSGAASPVGATLMPLVFASSPRPRPSPLTLCASRPPPLGDQVAEPAELPHTSPATPWGAQPMSRREAENRRKVESHREAESRPDSPRGLHSPSSRRHSRGGSPRGWSPGPGFSRVSVQTIKSLLGGRMKLHEVQEVVTDLLMEDLPNDNVADLQVLPLENDRSKEQFLETLYSEGGRYSRIRVTWHLACSAQAASAITREGIRCDEEHCACGRYGRGGYVALSAAKANAYADSAREGGQRALFLVLALPDEDVVVGERGTRPLRTAADLPSCPTEYCFVDGARLHCLCLLRYSWIPTGRREKVVSAGDRISHRVRRRRSITASPPGSPRGVLKDSFRQTGWA